MERNTIVGMVIAMIVVIAGISVITIPMISEMSDNIHSTDINEGTRYSLAETNNKIELEIINGIGYVNNKAIKDEYGYRMLMFSNTFIIVYDPGLEPNVTSMGMFTINGNQGITKIVADKGTWTATTTGGTTTTGTYEWLMCWNKNGNYGAVAVGAAEIYVNNDSQVYLCGVASESNMILETGTLNNMSEVFKVGDEPTISIVSEQYTSSPNVLKITNFECSISPTFLFVPLKYDTFTSFDQILKTMIDMAPVLIGLMFLAAVGFYMTRNLKM